jgi:streptomycin 3"-adenylyltransferase
MRDLLPTLLAALNEDTRNVLLTLARMWRTASSGAFVSKDEAAIWALPKLNEQDASILDYARQAYLGEVQDNDWQNRRDAAKRLAEQLALNVAEAMAT